MVAQRRRSEPVRRSRVAVHAASYDSHILGRFIAVLASYLVRSYPIVYLIDCAAMCIVAGLLIGCLIIVCPLVICLLRWRDGGWVGQRSHHGEQRGGQ
jgi:hypothetical protein